MRRRRNPLIWQGVILVILLVFVAYGAYHIILDITKTSSTEPSKNEVQTIDIANLERQIKSMQSDNNLIQKELNSANARIANLEKQLEGIDKIMATLSNPFAPGDEITIDEPVKRATVTTTPLNVRKDANPNSSKIGALTKGTEVLILEEKKVSGVTWYKVSSDLHTGWVHGNYVKLE